MGISESGQDKWILSQFDGPGHAVDIGANDGIFLSNTMLLEENGWTVLCVEPNPNLVEHGTKHRKLWRQVAAGATNGKATFTSVGGHPYASWSGMQENLSGTKHEVEVLTLDTILEQAGFHKLDVLSMDCEGWEKEVLKGFSIERWKPKVIVMEDWNDCPVLPGYKLVDKQIFDYLFVREDA